MNPNNMDPNQLNQLLQTAAKKLNTNPDALRQQLENGNLQNAYQNMSPQNAAKLQKILSDPKLTEQFLSSPQIQARLQKIMKGKG